MKAVILSNESQYRKFLEIQRDLSGYSIFCDHSSFYPFLTEKNISFTPLDEFLLEERWKPINAWGCGKANEWIQFCRDRRLFSKIDFASVMHLYLAHLLIQAVKNLGYAEWICETYRPSSFVLFDAQTQRKFPFFSGNFYLNYFLRELAVKKNIPYENIPLEERETLQFIWPVHIPWPKKVLRRFKEAVHALYVFFSRPEPRDIVAFGSLKHLSPTILELLKNKIPVALYDFEFHTEQFLFAARRGIPYWIPACFREPETDESGENARRAAFYDEEIRRAFSEAVSERLFVDEDYDFGPFALHQMIPGLEEYLGKCAREAQTYASLVRLSGPAAFLVDEDYALKCAFLAGFMNAENVPVYCVSHANLAVDFSVKDEQRAFGQSITMVHSEFEKSMYAARGWDPEKIRVTGTPRYDCLIRLSKERRPRREGPIRLLYAASGLWLHTPDQHGYLGAVLTGYGDFQRPSFRLVLNAVKGLPIELVVKPHSAEAVCSWRRFVQESKPQNKITVTKHSEDFFKLLTECDGMILSYWSTALIEAALCRKTAFFVSGGRHQSEILRAFAGQGFCRFCEDQDRLRAELERFCRMGPAAYREERQRQNGLFFLGNQKPAGAAATANLIIKALKKESGEIPEGSEEKYLYA